MQDNKSYILLQNNHPLSLCKESKHFNARYYFVVDKIERKEGKIKCCPTEEMVADYSNKPTQGGFFVKKRNTIQEVEINDFEMCKS